MNDSNSLHNTIKIADAIKNAALVVDKNNKPIYLNTAFITTFNSDKNKTLFEVKNSLQINPEKNCITIEKSEFIYQKLELSNNDNNYFLITIDLQSKKTQNNNYLNQKDILDIIPDIISIHDSQNNIIYFNQAGLNFMGQQQDKLIGKKCYSLINKNQQCNNCPSKECVETGKITEASRYFPELEKWFNIRAYPIKNDKNKVVQIIEHIRDITNQKQNETKLEETQETQIRLIENIPGIVYKCKIDRNWTMLFMSHETKNITGYTPEDFINNKNIAYADIIHPEDKKLVKQNITESIPVDSYFIIEYRIITKTGDIKYVWEKGKAVLKDHNKYIDGVIIDISERKKAEIELAISENKYRLLVQNQNELIVKIDKHGRFTYVSETYCKLFEKTEAELLNKNFMPLVHEEDQQLTNIEISKLSRHPYKCYLEQRALTASGWRWLAWSDKAI